MRGERKQRSWIFESLAGYTLYYRRADDGVREWLHVYNISNVTVDCGSKWTQHLLVMNDTRIPKLVYEYTATGRRNLGRRRKRWLDQQPWRRTTMGWPTPCCCCYWWWRWWEGNSARNWHRMLSNGMLQNEKKYEKWVFALLGCYASYVSDWLPTFQNKVWVLFSGVTQCSWADWLLNMDRYFVP
jgi:hypothetical protein